MIVAVHLIILMQWINWIVVHAFSDSGCFCFTRLRRARVTLRLAGMPTEVKLDRADRDSMLVHWVVVAWDRSLEAWEPLWSTGRQVLA